MKLNEYINMLTELLNKEGNLEVKNALYPQCTVEAKVDYMRIPKDKRQSKIAFWSEYLDDIPQKGEKVIKV